MFGGEDIGWEGVFVIVVEDLDLKVFVVFYDMILVDEKNFDWWEGFEFGIY